MKFLRRVKEVTRMNRIGNKRIREELQTEDRTNTTNTRRKTTEMDWAYAQDERQIVSKMYIKGQSSGKENQKNNPKSMEWQ